MLLDVMFPHIEFLVLVMGHDFSTRNSQVVGPEDPEICEGTARGYALAILEFFVYGNVTYDQNVPPAINNNMVNFIRSIVSFGCLLHIFAS